MSGLQCFDDKQYASFMDCERLRFRCIAPTAAGTRCNIRGGLNPEEVDKAGEALRTAYSATNYDDRYASVEVYVLNHCCTRWHQKKIRSDRGCLDKVVRAYIRDIWGTPVDSQPSKLQTQRIMPYFTPYEAEDNETVRDLITQIVPIFRKNTDPPQQTASNGALYILIWPEHPSLIKIGFSGRSARIRMQEQQTCYPGIMGSSDTLVSYPERLEGLIHLELAQYRHEIPKCKTCMRTHSEWFMVSADIGKSVMSAWAKLVEKEPLYDDSRSLTVRWRKRLSKFRGKITAKSLLDLLETEEEEERKTAEAVVMARIIREKLAEIKKELAFAEPLASNIVVPTQDEAQVVKLDPDRMPVSSKHKEINRKETQTNLQQSDAPEVSKKEDKEETRIQLKDPERTNPKPAKGNVDPIGTSVDVEQGEKKVSEQVEHLNTENEETAPAHLEKAEPLKNVKEEEEETHRSQPQSAKVVNESNGQADHEQREGSDMLGQSDASSKTADTAGSVPLATIAASEVAVENLAKTVDILQRQLVESLVIATPSLIPAINSAVLSLGTSTPADLSTMSPLDASAITTTPEAVPADVNA